MVERFPSPQSLSPELLQLLEDIKKKRGSSSEWLEKEIALMKMTAVQEWLDQHRLDLLVDDMHFVAVQESKEHSLKELLDTYDIFAFVEDNPYHASSVIGIVPEIYLINRSWNKSHHSVDVFKHVSTALEAAIQITQLR